MMLSPTQAAPAVSPATYARFKATLPALWAIKKRNAKNQSQRDVRVALDTIVLHDTESTAHSTFEKAVRYFADPQDGRPVSIHYLIGREYGEIVAMVPEHRKAIHCVGYNDRSIGIELYKKKIDTGDFSDWQYSAAAQLVCDIRLRWCLAQSCVKSHDELGGKMHDPRNFDWPRFEVHVKSLFLRLKLIDPTLNI
jgi:N-acetyl-anhydromuramyl-L-alanine amidase AmpD